MNLSTYEAAKMTQSGRQRIVGDMRRQDQAERSRLEEALREDDGCSVPNGLCIAAIVLCAVGLWMTF